MAPSGEHHPSDERGLTGVYRRRIRLDSPRPGLVLGALEDTAHHVRVTLTHGHGRVLSVRGEAVRLPWATCPAAAAGLASLVGSPLTTSLAELRAGYSPEAHCTHYYDLAQLAVTHAARDQAARRYELIVSGLDGPRAAYLFRDGVKALEWQVEEGTITGPEPFAGVALGRGFVTWCETNLDDDTAEAAFVLRRAASMAGMAGLTFDDYPGAADAGLRTGVCFTAQPGRIAVAFRNVGTQRDYTRTPDGMLEGFDDPRPGRRP